MNVFDLTKEEPITTDEAAMIAKCCTETVVKWIHRGHRGVKLEGGRIGAELRTSREAMQRFMARLSLADGASQ